jgi:hypothetical protein
MNSWFFALADKWRGQPFSAERLAKPEQEKQMIFVIDTGVFDGGRLLGTRDPASVKQMVESFLCEHRPHDLIQTRMDEINAMIDSVLDGDPKEKFSYYFDGGQAGQSFHRLPVPAHPNDSAH